MSSNITRFKVHRLELALPFSFDFQRWLAGQPESAGKQRCVEDRGDVMVFPMQRTWILALTGPYISGSVEEEGESLTTNAVKCTGVGSGDIYRDILIPLFKAFKGSLVASVAWADATAKQLNIDEGEVWEVDID